MDKEQLVSVYIGLLEVDQNGIENSVPSIAEQVEFDEQQTELLLDELEHMGLIEMEGEEWVPILFREQDG